MPPDAEWPNVLDPLHISADDHAAHRSPRGVPLAEHLVPGQQSHKMAKLALKIANKPHLKLSKSTRRKKK